MCVSMCVFGVASSVFVCVFWCVSVCVCFLYIISQLDYDSCSSIVGAN